MGRGGGGLRSLLDPLAACRSLQAFGRGGPPPWVLGSISHTECCVGLLQMRGRTLARCLTFPFLFAQSLSLLAIRSIVGRAHSMLFLPQELVAAGALLTVRLNSTSYGDFDRSGLRN